MSSPPDPVGNGARDRYEPVVRSAVLSDLAELVRLEALGREHLLAERGGTEFLRTDARPTPVEESLANDLADDDTVVLLGCLGPNPVGYVVAGLDQRGMGPTAVVTDLFVEEPARGVGVGRLLMSAVLDWAAGQDAVGVDAVALPGDRETKNFFESFGLVARRITVHRAIGPGPATP